MKIFTICCFVLFTVVACGDKPKATVHEVVVQDPMTADATPVPVVTPPAPAVVAPVAPEAEMSMDPTPVPPTM